MLTRKNRFRELVILIPDYATPFVIFNKSDRLEFRQMKMQKFYRWARRVPRGLTPRVKPTTP